MLVYRMMTQQKYRRGNCSIRWGYEISGSNIKY